MFVLDGDADCEFPKRAGIMMKYFDGLRALSSPISHSLSEITVVLLLVFSNPGIWIL